jgi:transcriptional regulator with XRE-family HTH domain
MKRMAYSKALRAARLSAGKTLLETAEFYGVSIRTYIRWEQGGKPDADNLLKISNHLGMDARLLMRPEPAGKR